nr:UDP-N-acetylglucosamine 1-carboxyvinyltransferase [uncultured Blautia sp.]
MNGIKITGGFPLQGEVSIQGSKNAALPMMAAALLNKGTTVLHGCPKISDVFLMETILQQMGVRTCWNGNTMEIHAENILKPQADARAGSQMRSSVVLLGSLLGRCGEASVPYPGGCVIGKRPIDLHIRALEKLGAVFKEDEGMLKAEVRELKGNVIVFEKRSVGATQNAVLGAVCAKGNTELIGCSREPEVTWLCRFLKKAGAVIHGIGTENLKIQGVKTLHDTEFRIPTDRIAAGTYICASAITRGEGTLLQPPMEEMGALLDAYEKIGGQYRYNSGKLTLRSFYADNPMALLETQVYPGFPTDLQSVFMAVLAAAKGESCIVENIFEDRFKTVSQLRKMGACIEVCGNRAKITGTDLVGTQVEAMELRGGAALIIAGLAARGETYVENRNFIERGYEDICRDLKHMGARILKD